MDFLTTHISKNAINYIKNVLDTTFLSEGKLVREFEATLAKQMGFVNPIAVNSGTTALHLALVLAGIKEGDEVIIPPQTFIATGLAVLMQKATPVFCDIQYDTGNMCPISLESKITDKTKAIIPVHWGGYPCDMDEINEIANKNNLLVIEDAAHAIGATYKGELVGSLSDFTTFSFQAVKHLTTGDGGAVCCKSENAFERGMRLRWFGIDRKNSKPSILGEREYDLKEMGYKYHLNDYAAALGLANLEDIEMILNRRREIADYYDQELKSVPGLTMLKYKNDRVSSYWLYSFHVDNRDSFIKAMKNSNIPTNVMHLRIDENSVFTSKSKELDNMKKYNETQICIPVHSDLSDNDIDAIVSTIKKGW